MKRGGKPSPARFSKRFIASPLPKVRLVNFWNLQNLISVLVILFLKIPYEIGLSGLSKSRKTSVA
jgi:hypothetical protein